VVIFLGILYVVISLVAVWREAGTAQQWYSVVAMAVALGVVGLGYGIRSGSSGCLYVATGLFVGLAGYFFAAGVLHGAWRAAVRFLLSGWSVVLLCRAVPAMHVLKQTRTKPLQTSRFGELFLRRKA
jgi:RsiW-degrading membrane proteinase PrsW (M82 family)